MSLKRTDWKAVLDQPKNVGMKAAGGTGIGNALFNVEEAEKKFQAQQTVALGNALDTALTTLKNQCDATVKKHKALYTTACAYLQTVSQEAANRMKALNGELNVIRQEEQEAKLKQQRRAALKGICEHALAAVRGAKDMKELNQIWPKFGTDLEKAAHGSTTFQATVNKVKNFKKQPDAKGILDVRKEYVVLVQEAEGASHTA